MKRTFSLAVILFLLVATTPFVGSGPSVARAVFAEDVPTLDPNDPGYDPTWGEKLGQYPMMLGEEMQSSPSGSPAVIVILDEKIRSHPDLDANHLFHLDRDFTSGGQSASKKRLSPAESTRMGKLLGSHLAPLALDNPHGMAVASIIAASTNNGMGAPSVAGLLGSVKFASVDVVEESGMISTNAEVAGLDYAASLKDAGTNVVAVVCSFAFDTPSELETAAVNALTNNTRKVVVFAGTLQRNAECTNVLPACLGDVGKNKRVVPVAALNAAGDGLDQPWSWGRIAAPTGVRVAIDPENQNSTAVFGGTSAATPQPAAVFALMVTRCPNMDRDALLEQMDFTSLPLPGTTTRKLNAYMAVTRRLYLVEEQATPGVAVAVNPTNFKRGPFKLRSDYLFVGENAPTVVMLLAYNLPPTAAVVVNGEDVATNRVFTLPIVSVRPVDHKPFLTQVVIKLGDELVGTQTLRLKAAFPGKESNTPTLALEP